MCYGAAWHVKEAGWVLLCNQNQMQEDDLLSFEEHDKSFEEHMQRMSELSYQSEQFTSSQNKLTIGRKRTRIETTT